MELCLESGLRGEDESCMHFIDVLSVSSALKLLSGAILAIKINVCLRGSLRTNGAFVARFLIKST